MSPMLFPLSLEEQGTGQETLEKSLKAFAGAALRTLQFAKPIYTQGLVDHSQNSWGGWRLEWA